tara:strand:- start:275 stop:565 length:291 start_codon:yes stop_codon:yes gene_type:complete
MDVVDLAVYERDDISDVIEEDNEEFEDNDIMNISEEYIDLEEIIGIDTDEDLLLDLCDEDTMEAIERSLSNNDPFGIGSNTTWERSGIYSIPTMTL